MRQPDVQHVRQALQLPKHEGADQCGTLVPLTSPSAVLLEGGRVPLPLTNADYAHAWSHPA